MERQLKERLIGAAVLVAVAVVMLPELFSGSTARVAQSSASTSNAALKSYSIELQAGRSSAGQEAAAHDANIPTQAVQAPAEHPKDEISNHSAANEAATSQAVVTAPAVQHAPAASAASVNAPSSLKAPAANLDNAKPVNNATAAATWVVQVGSFASHDKAQQIAGKLKAQGYAASVGAIKVGVKTLYRVRVGAVTERAAAEVQLHKVKAIYPGASVVAANR